jgi:hypothetical protein
MFARSLPCNCLKGWNFSLIAISLLFVGAHHYGLYFLGIFFILSRRVSSAWQLRYQLAAGEGVGRLGPASEWPSSFVRRPFTSSFKGRSESAKREG